LDLHRTGMGAVVLPDDRRRDSGWRPVARLLVPGLPSVGAIDLRTLNRRLDLEFDSVRVVPPVLAECAIWEA
jgi:hypothetical protein